MMFSKDLGPVAQKVALRKLQALPAETSSLSCNPVPISNLLLEPPPCRIPEAPTPSQPCPRTLEPKAIIPTSGPPIPADRPSRQTVLGLMTGKVSSLNRDTGERASNAAKGTTLPALQGRASPLPLVVSQHGDIDLNRRATAAFPSTQISTGANTNLADLGNGQLANRDLATEKQVVAATAPQFSFDLRYLKEKLDEMNSKGKEKNVQLLQMNYGKELQVVAYDGNQGGLWRSNNLFC